ncbi:MULTISPECIES: hypothetical protein [unclassified Flavobacterium]|jgi:hypothetical protein|uniref:hypothetical protein n=1 Tax=unclassified Flavobacterium TaxID=196869 RepID=UPI0025C0E4E7|nr:MULTISPECIES: hypothetical protein [unclassified Flavobacterium]
MKNILVIILTLSATLCFSQIDNYKFPKIKPIGKNKNDFIPTDWTILDTISGDFNKDSLNDIAVVIQTKKPLLFEDKTCFSTEPFYPKILIILLRQTDKTFQLSTTATKLFGNCNWDIQGQEPFEKIEVRRNTLGIKFLTGGTSRNSLSYYFRLQNNEWYLIGAESFQYWAGHTNGKDAFYNEKINFVTSEKEMYNEDQNRKKNSYKKTKLKQKPLIKMMNFDENSSIPFSEN